ncbi:hypothetical protein E4U19_000022 [Claviceps sp. Clav32 group G5]|nr:hypothetical protein E4U40_002848 [Claviceps sp. LM458 group G5]KAG6040108.1 hypothetical protein E4U19_000022 [Claviceps sp. Clav32 group G5]KAG6048700.1 hypothetical protein E4U39_007119 [Claviceps sp. Clav50 group G5]
MASVAYDFQKIITDARERKRNADLADKIFNRDRKQSPPSKSKPPVGGSLASRVGVQKPRIPTGPASWTPNHYASAKGPSSKKGSLSSRVTAPGTNNAKSSSGTAKNRPKHKAKLATALSKADAEQINVVSPSARDVDGKGMSIRGLAGLYAVMGQNFAPGTTAADIESAMTPVGGEMFSCKIVKTTPFLLAEMVFSSKEGGERVIEMFHNKIADGRVLKMYPKLGGYKPSNTPIEHEAPANAPSGPRNTNPATARHHIVDGSMGFPDPMNDSDPYFYAAASTRLYSDDLARVGGGRYR